MRYRRGPIEFHVSIPQGYRGHLEALQQVLGDRRAPYFGPAMYYPEESLELWEGNRGMEEYAREVFPTEEAANGCTWMNDDDVDVDAAADNADADDEPDSGTGTPGGGASNGYGAAGTPGEVVTM